MAYNTKEIKKDIDGNPISQYYNPTIDEYEPVEGVGGGNAVILYNEDGTENNELSLIPILDKLTQLTGTVLDEDTRKSNELLRIALYDNIDNLLTTGQLKGDKGDTGSGLEFNWNGTQLGIRVEGELDYIYVELKGEKGEQGIQGETGSIEGLDSSHVVGALGFTPANNDDLVAHKADFMSHGIDNAGFHNSIFRGKNLGTSVTTKQYADIANGTFEDLYIGDYWTISGINWRIAAFNYYRNTGDTLIPGNHITIVPDTRLYAYGMNPTNITTGGYAGSDMYINGLEQAKTTIRGIFGSHLVKHRQLHSNATVDGKASGWAWVDSEVDLMSEIMVYGSTVWGESVIGGTGFNIGVGKNQLPLFALNPQSINIRQSHWLRDVISASHFAAVHGNGSANNGSASSALGVRPLSLYRKSEPLHGV